MLFEAELKDAVARAFNELYAVRSGDITINATRKEFPGDLTVVTFNLAKAAGKNPEILGQELGGKICSDNKLFTEFNVIKGFLNISVSRDAWLNKFNEPAFQVKSPSKDQPVVLVEYSSPNTNKPLHLGHLRNILLGYSVSELLKASGVNVVKVNLINDRGIHICKSMLAWKKAGGTETPENSGIKGDHLVGKYYVEFDKLYKQQVAELITAGLSEEEAKKASPVMEEAREMLRLWEANDPDVIQLWKTMNGWVYDGFAETYKKLNVDFDRFYYESETYLLGKDIVQQGLQQGVFYQKPDGSTWVDLSDDGLDEKLVMRADGTSVYITQDIGTAKLRFDQYGFNRHIYVVGNEQDYHFKVLQLIMQKLKFEWWDKLFHLSYAMVDLPSGKMKSREGTVVDADDLMKEMRDEAARITSELGKSQDLPADEASELYEMIGMGALKYYILKVDPEKRMLFNPAESIDFNGNTGPFIQYTHARIMSVLKKGMQYPQFRNFDSNVNLDYPLVELKEKEVLRSLLQFEFVINDAASRLSPAVMANYIYELCKSYNQFYHEYPVVDDENPQTTLFRLKLSSRTAEVIREGMKLLGIFVPDKM